MDMEKTPKELDGKGAELPLDCIGFAEDIDEYDGKLNFYIPVTFDCDAVFGTDVCTTDNDDWLNVYVDYDMESGEVADHLDITLNRGDGSVEELTYPLDDAQRDALLPKMDAYCKYVTGKTLNEYAKEAMADQQKIEPYSAETEFSSFAITNAVVENGIGVVYHLDHPICSIPADVLEGLKEDVYASELAGVVAPTTCLTVSDWQYKGEQARWALDYEREHGVEPSFLDRMKWCNEYREQHANSVTEVEESLDDMCESRREVASLAQDADRDNRDQEHDNSEIGE